MSIYAYLGVHFKRCTPSVRLSSVRPSLFSVTQNVKIQWNGFPVTSNW